VYFRLGRYSEALVELEKASCDKPEGVVLDHLGDACAKAGQLGKAKDAWRRAVEALEKEKDSEKANQVKQKLKVEG
jgi:predicted negative regulator of RcsB-dependent stress response